LRKENAPAGEMWDIMIFSFSPKTENPANIPVKGNVVVFGKTPIDKVRFFSRLYPRS
jgi:hypothetical protein